MRQGSAPSAGATDRPARIIPRWQRRGGVRGARRSGLGAPAKNSKTRTPLSTKQKLEISVPGKPAGIEVRGRDVWVTALATNRLYRIDARRNEVVGRPIPVCMNPALLEVTDTDVWTACLGNRSVARVTYR